MTTLLSSYLAEGRNVDVCVWHKSQVLPATVYVNAALKKLPPMDSRKRRRRVQIRVSTDPSVHSGQKRKGRTLMRYHFP